MASDLPHRQAGWRRSHAAGARRERWGRIRRKFVRSPLCHRTLASASRAGTLTDRQRFLTKATSSHPPSLSHTTIDRPSACLPVPFNRRSNHHPRTKSAVARCLNRILTHLAWCLGARVTLRLATPPHVILRHATRRCPRQSHAIAERSYSATFAGRKSIPRQEKRYLPAQLIAQSHRVT